MFVYNFNIFMEILFLLRNYIIIYKDQDHFQPSMMYIILYITCYLQIIVFIVNLIYYYHFMIKILKYKINIIYQNYVNNNKNDRKDLIM